MLKVNQQRWACIEYENFYVAYRIWDGMIAWVSKIETRPYYPVGWRR